MWDIASSGPTLTPIDGVNFAWWTGNLPPGASGTITIAGVMEVGPIHGETITNTAVIASTLPDEHPADNDSTASSLMSYAARGNGSIRVLCPPSAGFGLAFEEMAHMAVLLR